ncbi:hypothetical protein P5673_024816 [Acropora cervicornis]|uniref:Uncharacterized protein n=1 Tax=Acropora cervicornis TaxID=6130 RepID=A0AAD9Q342_ACRCE|nr:hypothetical protein P5673_024816 [Acropora cervicornis]
MGPDSRCCALLPRPSIILAASLKGNFTLTNHSVWLMETSLSSSRDAADLRASRLYDVRPPPDGEFAR